jgi:hypothetical protein
MLRRLVHSLDALRKSRRLPAYLGCAEAWHGQPDTGNLAELDFSDIWHRRRCGRENLNLSLAPTYHARHWVDLATYLPLDCDHHHHELRSYLMLAVDVYAMPPATTIVGSSDRRHLH